MRTALLLAALLPLVLLPCSASAQKIEPGRWTGTVTPPDGQTIEVSYDVTLKGDTIGIAVNAGEHGTHRFNDVKLQNDTLTFWFEPGVRADCTLPRRADGAFEGACKDENGGIARMVLLPPRKE